ncbi:hypothetical protein MMC22_010799 [Lobaria immixta]|nr:hypothetical protein [Lobaria immixta]
MRFLSIIPTLFLTALTFGGTSQQTPVEGLAPRDLTDPSLFIVNGFSAVSFTIQFEIALFNLLGNDQVKATLAPGFNATETLVQAIYSKVRGIYPITNEAEQTAVINAESDAVNALSNLFTFLALKVASFDYQTKLYLYSAFASLKVVFLQLADKLANQIAKDGSSNNRQNLVRIFEQADVVFKVRTGGG